MWSLGVEGSPLTNRMHPLELLEEAVRLGLRVVQYGPNRTLTSEEQQAIGARARSLGLTLERGMSGLDPVMVANELALCRAWGCSLLRTVDLYEGPAPSIDAFAKKLLPLLPLLEAAEVTLAIENARMPAGALGEALDRIGSPWLGVTLDTVNSLSVPEGTAEVVRHLARHTRCLHVKDFRVSRIWHSMGFEVTGTPAGAGQLEIPALLEKLGDEGVNPNAILELWVPQQETADATASLERAWVEQSVAYLRPLMER
jgi:sugar phosphate isomerase/epimerase